MLYSLFIFSSPAAPSLVSANVDISIGGTGTDVALETADVVLMAGDLRHLPYAIHLSRAANRIIGQNVAFAFGMMLFLLASTFLAPVLSGGALSLRLPLAFVAHEGITVLVILNYFHLLALPRPAHRETFVTGNSGQMTPVRSTELPHNIPKD